MVCFFSNAKPWWGHWGFIFVTLWMCVCFREILFLPSRLNSMRHCFLSLFKDCIFILYVCVTQAFLTRSALLPDDKEIAQTLLGQLLWEWAGQYRVDDKLFVYVCVHGCVVVHWVFGASLSLVLSWLSTPARFQWKRWRRPGLTSAGCALKCLKGFLSVIFWLYLAVPSQDVCSLYFVQ